MPYPLSRMQSHEKALFGELNLHEPDSMVMDYVRDGMGYVKKKLWPVLEKIKGYRPFKEPDYIMQKDDMSPNTPAATLSYFDPISRLYKKVLIVSKDLARYPMDAIRHIIGHEEGHIAEGLGGDLYSEAMNDKNLVDAHYAMGDYETAKHIEQHSGYLQRLYGLARSLGRIFCCQ